MESIQAPKPVTKSAPPSLHAPEEHVETSSAQLAPPLQPITPITQRDNIDFIPTRFSWQGEIFLTKEQSDFYSHAIESIRPLIGQYAIPLNSEVSQSTGLYTTKHASNILKTAVSEHLKVTTKKSSEVSRLLTMIDEHLTQQKPSISHILNKLIKALQLEQHLNIDEIYQENKILTAYTGYAISIITASPTTIQEGILRLKQPALALYADFLIASEVTYDTQWVQQIDEKLRENWLATCNSENTDLFSNSDFFSPYSIVTARIWLWARLFKACNWRRYRLDSFQLQYTMFDFELIIPDANRSDFINCLFTTKQIPPLLSIPVKPEKHPLCPLLTETDRLIERLQSNLAMPIHPSVFLFGDEYEYWLDSDSSKYNHDICQFRKDFEASLHDQLSLNSIGDANLNIPSFKFEPQH